MLKYWVLNVTISFAVVNIFIIITCRHTHARTHARTHTYTHTHTHTHMNSQFKLNMYGQILRECKYWVDSYIDYVSTQLIAILTTGRLAPVSLPIYDICGSYIFIIKTCTYVHIYISAYIWLWHWNVWLSCIVT